jgi:hypothetical protein
MDAKVNKKVKYPENLKVRAGLKYGDAKLLADRSKYKYRTIVDVLAGKRRMTDALKKEIVDFINERKALAKQLEEAITNEL